MAIFCLMALVTGALAAMALPLLPFVIGLMLAAAVGSAATLLLLPNAQHAILGALALFVAAQVGYALGLGVQGLVRLVRERRREGHRPFKTAAHRLRHVNTKD